MFGINFDPMPKRVFVWRHPDGGFWSSGPVHDERTTEYVRADLADHWLGTLLEISQMSRPLTVAQARAAARGALEYRGESDD